MGLSGYIGEVVSEELVVGDDGEYGVAASVGIIHVSLGFNHAHTILIVCRRFRTLSCIPRKWALVKQQLNVVAVATLS